jgi:Ca2+-binding EF-hand superfamily protein
MRSTSMPFGDTNEDKRRRVLTELLMDKEVSRNLLLASIENSLEEGAPYPLSEDTLPVLSLTASPKTSPIRRMPAILALPEALARPNTAPANTSSLFKAPSRPRTSDGLGGTVLSVVLPTPNPPLSGVKAAREHGKGSLWQSPDAVVTTHLTPAFSEASLKTGHHAGLLDMESLHALTTYSKMYRSHTKSGSQLLLRNPQMAAAVKVPIAANVSVTELTFGNQKELYKNANKILHASNRKSQTLTRHLITMKRIEHDVKLAKCNKMLHSLEMGVELNDRGLLLEENCSLEEQLQQEQLASEMRMMRSSHLVPDECRGQKGILDEGLLEHRLHESAEDAMRELNRELLQDIEELKLRPKVNKKANFRRRTDDSRMALEKKLQDAILKINERDSLRSVIPIRTKKKLTTRDLLPFYRLEEVQHFLDIFASVDQDQNGALDMKEWISIFTAIDSALPLHEIISMFDGVDTRMEGMLLLSDMIPMLFGKANKEQRRLITQYAEGYIFSSVKFGKHLKVGDLQRLFECYDLKCLGFIPVPLIKERLQAMLFHPDVVKNIIDQFLGVQNDEFVNLPEFIKLFRVYTAA